MFSGTVFKVKERRKEEANKKTQDRLKENEGNYLTF